MHPKWRAPACYVGVAVLCAVYLAIVPGVTLTDVCAGAGIGAALMWAINEWETGKWNVPLPVQPALAAVLPQAGMQMAAAGQAASMPSSADVAAVAAALVPARDPADTVAPPAPALLDPEPRQRVDSGAPTPGKMEKWEIDEKEPSWDATALAETWAKLRAELSINRPYRAPVSPDLPAKAQYVRGADAKGQRSTVSSLRPAAGAKGSTASKAAAIAKGGSAVTKPTPSYRTNGTAAPTARSFGAPTPAKPQSATPTYTLGTFSQNGGSSLLNSLASISNPSGTRAPAAKAPEPARPVGSFLRNGSIRPR